jgi:lipopolysaccharide export system protein LptC
MRAFLALLSTRRELRALSFAAAALVLIALLFYVREYGDSGQLGLAPETMEPLRRADSYLFRPQGLKYRLDGSIAYQWRADIAERQPGGEIDMSEPVIVGLREDASRWTAESRFGVLSADGLQLTLREQVEVEDLIQQARITTEQLLIDMDGNRVSSAVAVRLTTPNGHTDSVGMMALIDEQFLELLKDVRGLYHAQP